MYCTEKYCWHNQYSYCKYLQNERLLAGLEYHEVHRSGLSSSAVSAVSAVLHESGLTEAEVLWTQQLRALSQGVILSFCKTN